MDILSLAVAVVERGLAPDELTRAAIRRLCRARLQDQQGLGVADRVGRKDLFVQSMRVSPIAPVPEKANEQHYELSPDFFGLVLGPRRKYSCCFWADDTPDLAAAEAAALAVTCERAQLADGQQVLELGCGWGSLSLWMAERYPNSRITAVSNSALQRKYIEGVSLLRGLSNLRVITADMNEFAPSVAGPHVDRYDRIVSVEMFEHMRNYELLLRRIAAWLRPGGELFVHIFCHQDLVYPFESDGSANWMGRYFFTGGIMPSADLLGRFDKQLAVCEQWTWNGRHYQRTAEAWLQNLDAHSTEALGILRAAYGRGQAARWLNRWRVFFLAVSELFGYAAGEEWQVAHYRLRPVSPAL